MVIHCVAVFDGCKQSTTEHFLSNTHIACIVKLNVKKQTVQLLNAYCCHILFRHAAISSQEHMTCCNT